MTKTQTPQLKISKTRRLTWLAKAADFTVVTRGTHRVHIQRWVTDADDANGVRSAGDVTVSHTSGDDRKGTFVVHAQANLGQVGQDMALNWAIRELAD